MDVWISSAFDCQMLPCQVLNLKPEAEATAAVSQQLGQQSGRKPSDSPGGTRKHAKRNAKLLQEIVLSVVPRYGRYNLLACLPAQPAGASKTASHNALTLSHRRQGHF